MLHTAAKRRNQRVRKRMRDAAEFEEYVCFDRFESNHPLQPFGDEFLRLLRRHRSNRPDFVGDNGYSPELTRLLTKMYLPNPDRLMIVDRYGLGPMIVSVEVKIKEDIDLRKKDKTQLQEASLAIRAGLSHLQMSQNLPSRIKRVISPEDVGLIYYDPLDPQCNRVVQQGTIDTWEKRMFHLQRSHIKSCVGSIGTVNASIDVIAPAGVPEEGCIALGYEGSLLLPGQTLQDVYGYEFYQP